MLVTLDPATDAPSADLLVSAGVSDEAVSIAAPALNIRINIDRLIDAGLCSDALRLIAQALPKNYAVAWACTSLRRTCVEGEAPNSMDSEALDVVERWLAEPSDANREAARALAERGGYATAGCWIAAAAAWTGGSLAPKGYTVVPPPDAATGHAIHGALIMAAASRSADMESWLRQFVEDALRTFGRASERAGAVQP